MSSDERVMLLIDADNVSADVIEQAVALLLQQHGALHVRRAYGTAESAVKHQQLFKRLSIKPMVNLAAGKNSTDIALAVDALDLVLAERPEVVVIASSDSDFAPLVSRLREKGCRVRGIGQEGKTGDETLAVYDDFVVLEHHRAPAKKTTARKAPAKKAAVKKTPARKTAARKHSAEVEPPVPVRPEAVQRILEAAPQLASGEFVNLNTVAEQLRAHRLLSKRASSTKLLQQHAEYFEMQPVDQPHKVRLRG